MSSTLILIFGLVFSFTSCLSARAQSFSSSSISSMSRETCEAFTQVAHLAENDPEERAKFSASFQGAGATFAGLAGMSNVSPLQFKKALHLTEANYQAGQRIGTALGSAVDKLQDRGLLNGIEMRNNRARASDSAEKLLQRMAQNPEVVREALIEMDIPPAVQEDVIQNLRKPTRELVEEFTEGVMQLGRNLGERSTQAFRSRMSVAFLGSSQRLVRETMVEVAETGARVGERGAIARLATRWLPRAASTGAEKFAIAGLSLGVGLAVDSALSAEPLAASDVCDYYTEHPEELLRLKTPEGEVNVERACLCFSENEELSFKVTNGVKLRELLDEENPELAALELGFSEDLLKQRREILPDATRVRPTGSSRSPIFQHGN